MYANIKPRSKYPTNKNPELKRNETKNTIKIEIIWLLAI